MHAIWHYLGFMAETIIFLLTGIIVGAEFRDLEWQNIWRTMVLYIALHIIRFLYILLFTPILTRLGYQF